jgi:predicted Zn-dependent protease
MTLASLVLLSALGAPYFTRPVDPAADLERLRGEIRLDVARPEAWHGQLKLYLELGELDTIPDLVELLAETFPGEAVFLEARMMFLSLQGRHEEAIAQGEAILRDHPGHPTVRANLGRVHFKARHPAQGVNLLLAAVAQGPIRVEDWDLLLENLGVFGDSPDSAVATLRDKIARHPELPSLRYVLMVALVRLGHYAEAREELTREPEMAAHPDLQQFLRDCPRD